MTETRCDERDIRDPGEAEARAWHRLVETARRTVADGLVVGTSGNVSVRVAKPYWSPSGMPYDRLTPGDVTGVALDGRQVLGTLVPTSELPMHLAIYRTTARPPSCTPTPCTRRPSPRSSPSSR